VSGPEWPEWSDLLRSVLEEVDGQWFEIDWEILDADYQYAQEDPESGKSAFAAWLTYIPLKTWGFSDYDESWPEAYPALALLRGLLGDGTFGEDFLVNLLEQYDITTDFTEVYSSQLWQRLDTADWSAYRSPLCYLPDAARIACGRTGNVLLDSSNYMEEEPLGWTWADDLELARQTYAAAAPAVAKLKEFLRWCDGPAEMQAMVAVLVGPLAGPKPKRKRKKQSKINALVDILTPDTREAERIRIR
jgi:hypothetical protein